MGERGEAMQQRTTVHLLTLLSRKSHWTQHIYNESLEAKLEVIK